MGSEGWYNLRVVVEFHYFPNCPRRMENARAFEQHSEIIDCAHTSLYLTDSIYILPHPSRNMLLTCRNMLYTPAVHPWFLSLTNKPTDITFIYLPLHGSSPTISVLYVWVQTTSLFELLCDHPLVGRPKCRETHFFDWRWRADLPSIEQQYDQCKATA